jgi:hypothetical protein
MKLSRSDREAASAGAFALAIVALIVSLAALFTAAHAQGKSNDVNDRVDKLAAGGVIGSTAKVTLEEFSITSHPGLVQSGKVTLEVDNVGSITHELVIVRAASVAALPRVTQSGGERAVGAIDEEAIPEADKMGESGDVPARTSVTKTFDLSPGTYVLFCNIDNKVGTTVRNHFKSGMFTTLIAV